MRLLLVSLSGACLLQVSPKPNKGFLEASPRHTDLSGCRAVPSDCESFSQT